MAANLWVEDGYVEAGWIQSGIEIDWDTGVIFVPKAVLTVVQTSPTEIYNLDLDFFWRAIRALEDTDDGRPWPRTCDYNQAVTVGGTPLAPVLIITDYYTVTFEDGQYAVNLIGANTNVQDRTNVNSVSVRPQNSAGLTNQTQLRELWQLQGLDVSNPMTVTPTSRDTGTISQVISGDGQTSSTVTRQ